MKQWLVEKLTKNLEHPELLTPVILGAGTTLSLQVSGVAITYGVQVLLARWMGASEYGIYEFAIALATFLSSLASLGLPNAALRFIPEYRVKEDWQRLQGIIWGSWRYVIVSSLLVAIVGSLVVWIWQRSWELPWITLLLGVWMVPLFALVRHQLEMARAIRRLVLAYFPSLVAFPLLVAAGTFVWQQMHADPLTNVPAIAIAMASLLAIASVQLWWFRRQIPLPSSVDSPIYERRTWFSVSFPILLAEGAMLVLNQTDILMLGAIAGSFSVGIYGAAVKTSGWVTFVLMSVNAISAPTFAALYTDKNYRDLQTLVSTAARWMFFPSFGIALCLVLFSNQVLGLFGEEFLAAKGAMVVLILGQLVNVGAGSVGYLMQMTGHQNQCAMVFGSCAGMNVVLNVILIPTLGVLGAAIATAFTRSLWNIWLHQLVVKYIGVQPSIVSAFSR